MFTLMMFVCFDRQLLDELGRGTSTSDGLSIANAVVDALLRRSARSIFATHYHKLNVNFLTKHIQYK